MKLFPLTVNDFIDRAELLYPDRTGIVDEPDQPAESWDSLSYQEVADGPAMAAASTRSASVSANGWRWSATTRPG